MGAMKNGTRKGDRRRESLRRAPRLFLPPTRVLSSFTVYSQVLDALYTILRNVAVCALTSSRLMIFPILLLIFCNDNNIFWGKAGHFGGGSFYPSNTLDRTLPTLRYFLAAATQAILGAQMLTSFPVQLHSSQGKKI